MNPSTRHIDFITNSIHPVTGGLNTRGSATYNREIVKKAVYGAIPELIYEKDLSPMEAMSYVIYEMGHTNSEVSEIMTDILGREVNQARANDYRRRAVEKLLQDDTKGDHHE